MTTVDNTELRNAYKVIKQQTYMDELTQLDNRKSYNEKIEESMAIHKRYGTAFSLLMLDIDFFKNINDTYGHSVGDKVLVKLGKLVKSTLRKTDFLFRIGGEEFIILLTDTDSKSATVLAEKIRQTIEKDLKTIENKTITVSIGIAQVNKEDNVDTIFKRVEEKLYEAK